MKGNNLSYIMKIGDGSMEQFKKDFINQCKNNRQYLGLSYKDISMCLVDVSEDEYESFEEGNDSMSKENIQRLIKLLCLKKTSNLDYAKYIDTTGLNEEEIQDLCNVLEVIVGDENA